MVTDRNVMSASWLLAAAAACVIHFLQLDIENLNGVAASRLR